MRHSNSDDAINITFETKASQHLHSAHRVDNYDSGNNACFEFLNYSWCFKSSATVLLYSAQLN